MGDLHDKIRDGEYSIQVKKTRVGRIPALNKGGERTLTEEEHEELKELLNEYEDLILRLYDAHQEEDDSHVRAWRLGKIYKEEVKESEQYNMTVLNPLLPFVKSNNRANYLYRRFYEMFPDQEWEGDYSPMTLADFAQRGGEGEEGATRAREIYDAVLQGEDLNIRRKDIRAWADVNDPTLENIVTAAYDRIGNPTLEEIKRQYRLHQVSELPSDEEIQRAIDDYDG